MHLILVERERQKSAIKVIDAAVCYLWFFPQHLDTVALDGS